MAPAITHFLVGAALVLLSAVPLVLRYEIDREHAIWLIPVGGVWGLAPDIHHIAPVFADTLYAFHNTPWADLFGLHYTLDRPAIRARYYESVFGSIVFFVVGVGVFWTAGRVRRASLVARRPLERAFVVWSATMIATPLATIALGVAVSVQDAFPTVARLVGSSSVLAGGLVVVFAGLVLGVVLAGVLELALSATVVSDPLSAGVVAATACIGIWMLAVPAVIPVLLGAAVPQFHAGSLAAFVVYGTVFGVCFGLVRGAFLPSEATPLSLLAFD
ncbi:hypothetical protein JCM17823_11390 [Halorubrum gandharaense]